MSTELDSNDFINGQKACRDGEGCPEGASDSFCRGYSVEYTRQENLTSMSNRLGADE